MARQGYYESQPSRRYPEAFFLTDCSDESWRRYRDYCRGLVWVVPAELLPEVDISGELGIAWVNYSLWPNQHGMVVKNISIFVNESMFQLDGQDNRDLIPITTEHEIVESWVEITVNRAQGKRSRKPPKNHEQYFPHQMAVLAEFRLAHERGLAERYLALTKRWSKLMPPQVGRAFYEENQCAFEATLAELQSKR